MTIRAALWMAALLVGGCTSDPQRPPRTFVIQVDSLQVPTTVGRDVPLELNFYGRIGPDLCYVFDHCEVTQSQSHLEVRLWGRRTEDTICPTAISELRGRSYIKSPPHSDPVEIVVNQPSGEPLEVLVRVANSRRRVSR